MPLKTAIVAVLTPLEVAQLVADLSEDETRALYAHMQEQGDELQRVVRASAWLLAWRDRQGRAR